MCIQNTRDFHIIRNEDQNFIRNNSALIDITDIFNDQEFENIEISFNIFEEEMEIEIEEEREFEMEIERFLRRQIEFEEEREFEIERFLIGQMENHIEYLPLMNTLQIFSDIQNSNDIQRIQRI